MALMRATLTGVWINSVTMQNVIHLWNPDGTMSDLAVATELRDGWCTLLAAGQVNTFGWRNISVLRVGTTDTPTNLAVVVNGQDGTDNQGGSAVICVKFRLHTGFAGRHGRGRIYLPGYRSVYWSGGQLTSTGITNMTIRLNAIKARYVGPGNTGPVQLAVAPRSAVSEADMHLVDDISLSLTPGVQRRRNLGVGL